MVSTDYCAYCYVTVSSGAIQVCGKCHKRVFCSRQCQRLDWRTGHKRWCCQSGEKDHDYCIRSSPGKGLGMFALREFQVGEKIFVERPILWCKQGELDLEAMCRSLYNGPTPARDAVAALEPSGDDASLLDKILRNSICYTDHKTDRDDVVMQLFINLSRVNHCCIGNCLPTYMKEFEVAILVANRTIPEGEEITFPYLQRHDETGFRSRHEQIEAIWKFNCLCLACTNRAVGDKLYSVQYVEDDEILRLGSSGQTIMALTKGLDLIRTYDDLRLSPSLYRSTYSVMFLVAIMRPASSPLGPHLARQAASYAALFYGDDHKYVDELKNWAENPSAHRLYHILRQ